MITVSESVAKAILNSNMSTDEKIGALVLMSQKRQKDADRNKEARKAILEVLNGAMGEPMRAKDIRACLPDFHPGILYGALRTLSKNGVLNAKRVEDGKVSVVISEWHPFCGEGSRFYSGEWVDVEKEVPNRYNLYTLNF